MKRIQCDDQDVLVALFLRNNRSEITNTFHPFPLTAETATWIACQPHRDLFFIAFQNDSPVGFSMLRGWENGFDIPSFGIFVDIAFHGRGIGKEILVKTIEMARKIGCLKMRLTVYAGNPAAFTLYKQNGFVEIHRTDVIHQGLPDQKITMIKDLVE